MGLVGEIYEEEVLFPIQMLCIAALTTDGGHHKQWYLEEILKKVVDEQTLYALKKMNDWEKGIEP